MSIAALVPEGDPDVAIFVSIMMLGFIVGTAGHVIQSRRVVIAGIVLIFAATVILPLAIFGNGR